VYEDDGDTAPRSRLEWEKREHEFAEFYRTNIRRAVMMAASVSAYEDPHDIAQEAMERIFRRWHTIEPTTRLGYLRTVVRNLAIDAQRRARRMRDELTIDLGHDLPGPDYTLASVLSNIDYAELRRVLDLLPFRQRAVITAHMDGMSDSEIAWALEIPPATARSNLRHARRRLRDSVGAREARRSRSAGGRTHPQPSHR